jgi:signal transduction histidine kinase
MFFRASEKGAGSGLGLYIVKETTEKLGGSVALESVCGQGTTVTVSLPQASEAEN